MVIVITILMFILMIAMIKEDAEAGAGFAIVIFFPCIIVTIWLTSCMISGRNIDTKIAMYTEENENIERKVKETVRVYMNFEENTYTQLVKDADLTTLIIKYPELNSNELVKKEIDLYIENNGKIKELKNEKIDLSVKKWWLYFGNK